MLQGQNLKIKMYDAKGLSLKIACFSHDFHSRLLGQNLKIKMYYAKGLSLKIQASQVMEMAKRTALGIYGEAGQINDDEQRKAYLKWAKQSCSKTALQSMLYLARSNPSLVVPNEDLDTGPFVLNVANGILDLKTGTLEPHDPSRLLTKLAPVNYDASATAPRWEAFIEWMLKDDAQLISWFQKWTGYCLTGTVKEQCLAFYFGGGSNGKTVNTEVLMSIMGDYAIRLPASAITGKNGGIPNDVATLSGVRLAVASELPEGQRFNEPLIKDLTGGDTIRARFLHKEWFTIHPTHKLVIFGNHKPFINGVDDGIWRRFRLVPFLASVTREGRNLDLAEELVAEESEGILAWAVRGCARWIDEQLGTTDVITAATDSYRGDMNHTAQFIDDYYSPLPAAILAKGEVYKGYQTWCEDNGYRACGINKLSERMVHMGWKTAEGKPNNVRSWEGWAAKAV